MQFSVPVRVYWEDTDAGGVVYHAQYVAFMERARTEWLRALGFSQQALQADHRLMFVVHSMSVDFKSPARLDEELLVTAELVELGRARFAFDQSVVRKNDGAVLVSARVNAAVVSADTFKPRGMPAEIRDQLAGAMTQCP